MTAFLKLDRCRSCLQDMTWEWVPPIHVHEKPLPGTGVWRSRLIDGLCPQCFESVEIARQVQRRNDHQRETLIKLLGGPKPYREFTFARYQVTTGNQAAFERAKRFDPATSNLYFWCAGRLGKTHLALAILRYWFEQGRSVVWSTPARLIRRLRMKPPDEEQQVIDACVLAEVFLLDDFGSGVETAYARQILQEILDGRDFQDRGGLMITSRSAPGRLARSRADDAISSRVTSLCESVEIKPPVVGRGPGQTDIPHSIRS
jgi:DNA replication protein DnaC